MTNQLLASLLSRSLVFLSLETQTPLFSLLTHSGLAEMGGGNMDADATLDYASFQILPSENRYEAYVCSDNKVEKLAEGPLEHLLLHLPEVNGLNARGCNSIFKLQLPKDLLGASWFTKSTLDRFLCIVRSSEFMHTFNAIKEEMSQLEEARKFHLSLYTQSSLDHLECQGTDDSNSGYKAVRAENKTETTSSDASKNELLRAMELRLTALETELATAFNQAAGSSFFSKEAADLAEFLQFVGARDLKECLCKVLEVGLKSRACNSATNVKSSLPSNNKPEENAQLPNQSHTIAPVKYGASPAKVALIERNSSTESDGSVSSDEDRMPVERSRTLMRSATPRRSASPMRRIQIGRTGPRRPAALAIKSLIPAREKVSSYRDEEASGSETDESGLAKKPSSNVRRISVQDAISLFERKQMDQTAESHNRSLTQVSVGTKKAVLRRWSAGMAEPSQSLQDSNSKDSVSLTPDVTLNTEEPKGSEEEKLDEFTSGDHQGPSDSAEVDANSQEVSNKIENQANTKISQAVESPERPAASTEWHQQKEAELKQMLMKMMQSEPTRNRKPHNSRNKNTPTEQKGSLYDQYKEKRSEKRNVNAGKRAEKEAKPRTIQKPIVEKKTKPVSSNLNDVGKKHTTSKLQKSHKNPSPLANTKKEPSKPSTMNKVSAKTSSLPTTRKSWPSAPSPRTTASSPTKSSVGVFSVGPTARKKTQSASSLALSSPKVDMPPQQRRNVKEMQTSVDKSLKGATEKRQQTVTKNGRTAKTKTNLGRSSGDSSGMIPAKPKFTRKSSVVPLEPKPSPRKGSKVRPGPVPVTAKTKNDLLLEETQKECGNLLEVQEINEVADVSDTVSEQHKGNDISLELSDEPEDKLTSPLKCGGTENSDQVVDNGDDFAHMEDSLSKIQLKEESVISPRAWVEIEEHSELPSPPNDSTPKFASSSSVPLVGMSSPRVRHSLSQMLQEESSEPDIEWGNAENPPVMAYQRDAPKGLKRLLKFARRSKGESNTSGWSSPSVFSEGEDDTEESKAVNKRSYDNLLRKAALNAKNCGTQYEGSHALAHGQSGITDYDLQSSSNKQQEGRITATNSTTKATKSFFSLSAFRGSKPNETKLR